MTTCIRRAHAFWTTCTCPPCSVDRRRKAKHARTIGITRVSSEAAWSVIDSLADQGWTGYAIASAAGLPRRSVEGALTALNSEGRRTTFGPTTAAKIVNHGTPTAGQIGAHGARRRLQGLAMQGWDLYRLEELGPLNASTLAAIRSGATDRVNVAKHLAVVGLTERIGMKVGDSVQAKQNAIRKGWSGLLSWDDIDDRHAIPFGRYAPGTRADLLAEYVERGDNLTAVTRALDVDKETLQRWCARNGSSEAYRTLAAREGFGNRYGRGAA